MTIPAYGGAARIALQADAQFRSLKESLGTLQLQLSTGKTASTYAGLGAGAAASLSGRARIATLDGYASNVADAKLRVQLMSQGVGQIDKLTRALAASLPSTYNGTAIGQTTAEVSAEDGLKQAIDILNTDVSGRYLFSGRTQDTEPVASYDLIMKGDGERAGLGQLVAERKAADLGPDGRGRLTLSSSGLSTTVGEEAAGLPFGLKIGSATASGSGITASVTAGPPAAATIGVAAQPAAGDTVALALNLPDGTTSTVTLTAGGTGTTGTFAIGASPAETAANLGAALDKAVQLAASTTLASASTLAASRAFFAGSASAPPARVAGPPYATATATVAGTAADTVIWYRGDDSAGSARETAPVRTGDGTSVAIGARADEAGFQDALSALGALAADSFGSTDATSAARYGALADRIATRLGSSGGVTDVASDLSVANAALGTASDRIAAAKAHLQDVIGGVENADPNEVATKLLATQTRLQASYQTTAVIAKLSLVDYLR